MEDRSMSQNLVFGLTALLSLLPASVFPFRRLGGSGTRGRPRAFWGALALAAAGPLLWSFVQIEGAWHTGLSTALWVTIATCLVLFAGLAALTAPAWRLMPLLLPYLLLVGAVALATQGAPEPLLQAGAAGVWIVMHIAVSVVTYALLTLAAVAALSAFLQERALKAKRPTATTRFLPSVAESDRLQVSLLAGAETVLGLGLVTGMAVLYYEEGSLLRLDHKILLSIAAFVVIGALLVVHAVTGLRGRTAARVVLIAYLLLTLAYPGVKFVSGVLLH